MSFVHLHVHTQYSILDGFSDIGKLLSRAEALGMPGVAITDHGNMYGVKEFFSVCKKKHPGLKPIFGCEIYVTRHYDHKLKDPDHKNYYHLILLAKNYNGYKNLMKIVSIGHIEGRYYRPRVSHEVVERYAKDLICCSACVAGEVPKCIEAGDLEAAEKAVEWHKKVFGDDYYLEVQLHRTEVPGLSNDLYERQKAINEEIYRLAAKTGVKVVATNDVHFVNKEDGPVHDCLICMNTNSYRDSTDRLRYTQQEYLKSEEEMAALFPDHPEALANTMEIFDKIESFSIDRDHVLPKFSIDPDFLSRKEEYLQKYASVIDVGRCDKNGNDRGEEFTWSVAYLCHLCYQGARERYGESLSPEQAERIDFELKTISRMGFPDYFLIVQDFIAAARAVGTFVGPGRGSAAGSVVAYCLKITNLDPLKYDLLFERFLNPDRISMPDIDIDFDDEGRYGAFRYIEETYGKDHISHVITFGTMAARSAIKDIARISRMSLDETARLTKMVPDKNTFEADFEVEEEQEDGTVKKVKKHDEFKTTLKNCVKYLPELKHEYEEGSDAVREVLKFAVQVEGCVRQVGVHACAMIIGRGNLTDYIPITLAVDKASKEEVWTSQYDGHYIEEVGMLKMDFLGLKTLSIIKECLSLIKRNHGIDIDIEKIPIDDEATYQLYSRGDTKSVFQFESEGMKSWLQRLKPTRFEDLIAMNALYRPGPLQYIPSFVNRKNGQEEVSYDLPEMEDILQDTYGITVYQEQVMLLSQKLAGFTKGEADKLRKAMGKKQTAIIQELRERFISGATANGFPEKILNKIYDDWTEFAKYAFNKSHATCYAWVSYQTAWLKAHYPAEFQAANMSKNLDKQEEICSIMDDCKKAGIRVLNPDINESDSHFTANRDGNIRFGLGGIKGFGDNIVSSIIAERDKNGEFADIFDFAERMAGQVNRKAYEALIFSGAFDSFGLSRKAFFLNGQSGDPFIDELVRYADLYRKDSLDSAISLFGDSDEFKPVRPEFPSLGSDVDESDIELLHREKELVGMYLSSHPLDKYSFEMENFTTCDVNRLNALIEQCAQEGKTENVAVGGFITDVQNGQSKTGKPTFKATIEDFGGSFELRLFGKDIDTFMPHLSLNSAVYIKGKVDAMFRRSPEEIKEKGAPPYVLRPTGIMLLGNVIEDSLKGFALTIQTPQLNSGFRENLVNVIRRHKGKIPLTMFVYDPTTKYNIEFLSKKFKVEVSTEFVNELKSMKVSYNLVRK